MSARMINRYTKISWITSDLFLGVRVPVGHPIPMTLHVVFGEAQDYLPCEPISFSIGTGGFHQRQSRAYAG